jgi:membrane protein YdbS with pleckstrin-like domain
MQYRCPKCQSPKIMPVAQAGEPAARPVVPKSLVFLIPSLFVLLLLVIISIAMWIFGDGAGSTLQSVTVAVFVICAIAGFMFYKDLPDFKISMQAFMQSQKKWKCRECSNEWEI